MPHTYNDKPQYIVDAFAQMLNKTTIAYHPDPNIHWDRLRRDLKNNGNRCLILRHDKPQYNDDAFVQCSIAPSSLPSRPKEGSEK